MPGQQRFSHQAFMFDGARPYPQVKTIPCQVSVVVIELQLDLHLRVLLGELQQQAIEEGFTQRHWNGHTHRASQIIFEPRQCLAGAFHLHHQCLCLGQQRRAGSSQAQLARGAVQQNHGKLRFQLADALGQLPFAAAQLCGRHGETAGFDQHGERRQVIHFAHGLFPFENQRLPISTFIQLKSHTRLNANPNPCRSELAREERQRSRGKPDYTPATLSFSRARLPLQEISPRGTAR